MAKYRVKHGSLKTATGVVSVGETVELAADFVKHVDTKGEQFELVVEKRAAVVEPPPPPPRPEPEADATPKLSNPIKPAPRVSGKAK